MAPKVWPAKPGSGKRDLPLAGGSLSSGPEAGIAGARSLPSESKPSPLHAARLPQNALRPAPLFADEQFGGKTADAAEAPDVERVHADLTRAHENPTLAGPLHPWAATPDPPAARAPSPEQPANVASASTPPPWAPHEAHPPRTEVNPPAAARSEPSADAPSASLPQPAAASLSDAAGGENEADWNLREVAKSREQDLSLAASDDQHPAARKTKDTLARQLVASEAGLRQVLGFERWSALLNRLWHPSKSLRRLAKIAAVVLVLFTPLGDSLKQMAGGALASLHEHMSRRAAFQVVEEFPSQEGPEWDEAGTLSRAAFGAGSLSLHRSTMKFVDYHADFVCRLEGGSVSWAVRAADHDTYLAFRLLHTKGRSGSKYVLLRFPVIEGKIDESEKLEVDVSHVIGPASNRVSVRLRGQTVGTFVNGRGVDFWKDSIFQKGGVGLWFKPGGPQRVQRLAVYGNEDLWGLTLYGALQIADKVRKALSSVLSDSEPDRRASLGVPLEATSD